MMETKKRIQSEEAAEARRRYQREYQKKWRALNREKVREYNVRYWEKQAILAAAKREAAHE